MKTGPKRKPDTLKVADGTHRPTRDGDPSLAPKAPLIANCPTPPEILGKDGRAAWIDVLPKMIGAGFFTQLDLLAFERYCRFHDEVAKCDAILLADGEYTVAETGYVCQHPAVNQRFKWLDMIRRYEDSFWLNPTARSGKQISSKAKSTVPKRNRA
jgi:P27 family predicted phage terminase small subunit